MAQKPAPYVFKVFSPHADGFQFFGYEIPVIRMGRHRENDLRIPSPDVSQFHATLTIKGGVGRLEDHDSASGTFVAEGPDWTRVRGTTEMALPAKLRLADFIIELPDSSEELPEVVESCEIGDSCVVTIGSQREDRGIFVLDLYKSAEKAFRNEKMAFHLKKRLLEISKLVLDRYRIDIVKNTGDGFLATSPDPELALRAAESLMRALERRNQKTKNEPIEVRIALHYGETYIIDEATQDIHGNDVNVTFRMDGMRDGDLVEKFHALPEKDRILCSGAFIDRLPAQCKEPRDIVECGRASLKGIGEPLPVHLVRSWREKF